MNCKPTFKVLTDVLMTAGLLLLMGYHFWGAAAHEWIGAGVFLLFLLHHALNWRWWGGLFRGKYTAVRVFQLIINLLTLASMLGLMVSSMILSREVFAFLPIGGGMAFARMLHMVSAYWGFLLMAAHLGLHWDALCRRFPKTVEASKKWPVLSKILSGVIAGYGIFALFKRHLPDYLFLQAEFVFLDYGESKILFYLDYLAMMGTLIFLTHYGSRLMKRK